MQVPVVAIKRAVNVIATQVALETDMQRLVNVADKVRQELGRDELCVGVRRRLQNAAVVEDRTNDTDIVRAV